jgi:cytochrome c-type biogenesis protein
MGVEVSIGAAFLAGVLSISLPCMLPLVPLFLAHLAGALLLAAVGAGSVTRATTIPDTPGPA